MDDYEAAEKKQAAIRVLSNYSQFAMTCLGEGVAPHQLRLHLMKEISGMPSSLDAHRAPVALKAAQKAPVAQKREEASSSEASGRMNSKP